MAGKLCQVLLLFLGPNSKYDKDQGKTDDCLPSWRPRALWWVVLLPPYLPESHYTLKRWSRGTEDSKRAKKSLGQNVHNWDRKMSQFLLKCYLERKPWFFFQKKINGYYIMIWQVRLADSKEKSTLKCSDTSDFTTVWTVSKAGALQGQSGQGEGGGTGPKPAVQP